ncbi:hypothetical protein CYMTET_22126 [Cymbomonas tetramitiformis]|uniref:Prostaglandin E synthase 2 n=1 Tax=Cymbomonas tetramitiformis TaxID=36881 RepID=A0AAE0L2G5_9CHLO|nr:hypothetical protein CYMTET_22126 [Cymbomonas tetramitiformis]
MLRRAASIVPRVHRAFAESSFPKASCIARPYQVSAVSHFLQSKTHGGSPFTSVSWQTTLAASVAITSSGLALGSELSFAEPPPVTIPVHPILGEVVFYQYAVCPFCNKVKAFLDFHNVPYRVVEVNPLFKKELDWSEYKKVPVLTLNGDQINDSTEIISQLTSKLDEGSKKKGRKLFGRKKEETAAEEEEKWRSWVDDRFVHVLTPNLYRTVEETWQAFDYITQTGKWGFFEAQLARVSGSVMMYLISKFVLKKRHGIEDERAELYASVEEWVKAVGEREFLGGKQPNNADLSVFGVIRAVHGLDTWKDVMSETSVGPWYERMEAAVGGSSVILED